MIYTYGLEQGDFHAESLRMEPSGMHFIMVTPQGKVPVATRLTGGVNVYNLLAAGAAAFARGLTIEQVASGAASLEYVPGRFQSVDCGQDFAVVVDYAHSDDALRNIIAVAREFVTEKGGRVITMFGCGGDRDRTKRPLMGRAAGEGSDVVVVTSDNPRGEDPSGYHRAGAAWAHRYSGHGHRRARPPPRHRVSHRPGTASTTWCCWRARATKKPRPSAAR